MFSLDYRDARPIYTQICDCIRHQILDGVLQEGDRLSSVRELATELTINPNTIQRAYLQLEAEGWIASVPGKGSFVCAIPSSSEEKAQELWQELEELRRRMAQLGITSEEMIHHLTQGGNDHA
ncbi:MAG: GntR family transcriptional regulator [Ruminococcaceae bacterium]|nr:GntR family transcriptional regulator [Oscillospiraceae bacterium]